MTTRREFLTGLFGVSLMGLAAACGAPAAQAPTSPIQTSAPQAQAKPTTAAAPTQTAPAQAAGKPATAGGTLTMALENDVIDFDPMRSRAFVDRNVHYQIYDSLVRIDANGKIVPWLAEKWDTSSDGKQVTFTLRKGVKYHDGSAFDAEAVKWNIDRYRTTEGSARTGELSPVASVDVVDASTVRFNLKTPFSPLLALLVDRAGMMLSRKAVEAGGEDFTRKAFKAGTGPFVLTEAIKDDHITLEKNADWWGKDSAGNKLPLLDKVIVRPITNSDVRLTNLKTGDAHIANNIAGKDVAGLKNESALVYMEKPAYSWASIIPNRKPGFIFEEGRYVKAVSMAIDRQEILQKVYFGVGLVGYGTVAPSHFAFDQNFKPYEKPDPEGAKQLVQQVGKGPLSFELMISAGDPALLQRAQLIQAQLKKADIDAQITQLEFAQVLKVQADHTFTGMSDIGWSGRVDPDGNTYDQLYTGRPNNDSSYSNPEVDKYLDAERSSLEESARRDAFRKAEQIYVVDDPARAWYRFGVAQIAAAKSLQGLEVYPDQIIRYQNVSMQK